jgi:hypothetical protein
MRPERKKKKPIKLKFGCKISDIWPVIILPKNKNLNIFLTIRPLKKLH